MQERKPLSPAVSSAVSLAAMLASEATGESVTRCVNALEHYARRAHRDGLSDEEVIERLRAAGRRDDPVTERRWSELLRRFSPPMTREESTR